MAETFFSPFPSNDLGAATVVNIFAIISASALFSVAVRIIWLAFRQKLSPDGAKPREYIFFNTQLGFYATCLLIANVFTDVAGLIGLRWLIIKGIAEGTLCTLQAILMQFGTFSTAFFTVSIAVHTFNSLVLRKRQSRLITWITITTGWAYSAVLVAVPFFFPGAFKFGAVYGPDHLSCGVRSIYLRTQFYFHLLPIFIASLLSAILYPLVFLMLRGTLSIKGGIKLTLGPNERITGIMGENYHHFVVRVAKSMLWYPVAYIALLIPYSVVRLLSISGFPVAFGILIFAYVCWFMLGIVNVLLLYNTFRVLGPAFDTLSQRESVLSFGPSAQFDFPSDNKQQDEFIEKIAQYRNRESPLLLPTVQSSPILRPLLPVYQERHGTASVQSFYSYSSSPSIGRAITPLHELERSGGPYISPRSSSSHSRQATIESIRVSLPPAPRPTRSPIIYRPSREGTTETGRSNQETVNPILAKQFSTRTFGETNGGYNRASTSSAASSDFGSEWQMAQPNSALPSQNFPRPLLSAVKPNFASTNPLRPNEALGLGLIGPRHSRSLSAIPVVPPSEASRTMLGGRQGSIGSVSASGRIRTAGRYF